MQHAAASSRTQAAFRKRSDILADLLSLFGVFDDVSGGTDCVAKFIAALPVLVLPGFFPLADHPDNIIRQRVGFLLEEAEHAAEGVQAVQGSFRGKAG